MSAIAVNGPEWNAAIDRNYDAFLRQVAELLPQHAGRYALLHEGVLVALHDTAAQAYADGLGRFVDQPFSVQPVALNPVELGFLSRAHH